MYKEDKNGKIRIPWDDLDTTRCGNGENSILCPNCSDGRKKKGVKSFSVNMTKKVGKCNHCDAYSISEEALGSNFIEKKEYVLPNIEYHNPPSEGALSWFKKRGITEETVFQFRIRSCETWMPQPREKRGTIVFPYIRRKVVVNNKYRDNDKNFKLESKAELILFNLDSISKRSCVIVEGEPDCMAVHQCGMTSVVSVPNGAGSITDEEKRLFKETGVVDETRAIKLDYIDNCYNQLKDVEDWVIFTDTDLPGLKLRGELIRRFGSDKCRVVDVSHLDCKDANEVLLKHGADVLFSVINNAKKVPLVDVITVNQVREELYDLWRNGKALGLDTKMCRFNDHYRQSLNSLELLVGSANCGKTTYLIWYYVWTSCFYGWKHAIYSPESESSADMIRLIIQVLTGGTFKKGYKNSITETQLSLACEWVDVHFYFIEFNDENKLVTYRDVLGKVKEIIERHGVNTCTIDPINSLYFDKRPGESIDVYFQEMLTYMRTFKKRNNLKMIVAAHPNTEADRAKEKHKSQGDRPKVIELADVYGGSIFKNRIDNGISLYRNVFNAEYRGFTEIHIKKIKFQETIGTPTNVDNPIVLCFDPKIQRFTTLEGEDPLHGWFDANVYLPVVYSHTEVNYEPPKAKTYPSAGVEPPDFDSDEVGEDSGMLFRDSVLNK